jgi:hypothetical protein
MSRQRMQGESEENKCWSNNRLIPCNWTQWGKTQQGEWPWEPMSFSISSNYTHSPSSKKLSKSLSLSVVLFQF